MGSTLDRLRVEFAQVNTHDPDSLRTWLTTHPYLTVHDYAQVAGCCQRTIKMWKRKAGLVGTINLPQTVQVRKVAVLPPDWDNEQWFRMMASKHGMPFMMRLLGKDRAFIMRRYKKYGIVPRTHREATKSTNKYCDEQWLIEHYVNQKLSLSACSHIAGVARDTVAAWLVRFGIEVRSRGTIVRKSASGAAREGANSKGL